MLPSRSVIAKICTVLCRHTCARALSPAKNSSAAFLPKKPKSLITCPSCHCGLTCGQGVTQLMVWNLGRAGGYLTIAVQELPLTKMSRLSGFCCASCRACRQDMSACPRCLVSNRHLQVPSCVCATMYDVRAQAWTLTSDFCHPPVLQFLLLGIQ